MGESITFKRPDGGDCAGYYVSADSGDAAMGIVVLQEWRGVDEHIKDVAARLANNCIRHRELLTSNSPL